MIDQTSRSKKPNNGLPFKVKIPNKKTIQAMNHANKRKTHKAKNVNDLFEDLG